MPSGSSALRLVLSQARGVVCRFIVTVPTPAVHAIATTSTAISGEAVQCGSPYSCQCYGAMVHGNMHFGQSDTELSVTVCMSDGKVS